jgi:hypothetical protein
MRQAPYFGVTCVSLLLLAVADVAMVARPASPSENKLPLLGSRLSKTSLG